MTRQSRRDFLKTTGTGALAVGLGAYSSLPADAAEARTREQGVNQVKGGIQDSGEGTPPIGSGVTVWRGDPGYEETRRRMVWNERTPDRYPDVIVTVTSDADVVAAVKLARARGLRISVRAGGHSWIGTSLRDGGMLIDLSRLNGVTVDAAARTAVAQPAIKNTELVAALSPYGLAFPAGTCNLMTPTIFFAIL